MACNFTNLHKYYHIKRYISGRGRHTHWLQNAKHYRDCYAGFSIQIYRPTSNISRALLDNTLVDHSDVVGVLPVGAAPTIFLDSTLGFNGLGKENCKTRRKTLKFLDLVWLTKIFDGKRTLNTYYAFQSFQVLCPGSIMSSNVI